MSRAYFDTDELLSWSDGEAHASQWPWDKYC